MMQWLSDLVHHNFYGDGEDGGPAEFVTGACKAAHVRRSLAAVCGLRPLGGA